MQLAKTYNNNRLIRQAMLMTLPRLATAGNAEVIAGLDEVIKEGQGRQELRDLNFETELVRHFFSGGKP
jgi:hypothetical protein